MVQNLISGMVVHGRKMGREIGFPTANVQAEAAGLENGVYGVYVSYKGKQHRGIMNIGYKPTFGEKLEKTIEVHILNFKDDIYGEIMMCELLFKVREEKKFTSIEFLIHQIKEDIQHANRKFKHIEAAHQVKTRKYLEKERIS